MTITHCGKRVVNHCRNSQTLLLYNYIVNFEDLRGRWIFFTIIFICIEAQNWSRWSSGRLVSLRNETGPNYYIRWHFFQLCTNFFHDIWWDIGKKIFSLCYTNQNGSLKTWINKKSVNELYTRSFHTVLQFISIKQIVWHLVCVQPSFSGR